MSSVGLLRITGSKKRLEYLRSSGIGHVVALYDLAILSLKKEVKEMEGMNMAHGALTISKFQRLKEISGVLVDLGIVLEEKGYKSP
jgi:hypothetical protein